MAKSEELDWLMGPPSLKFGDIKEKIWDYVSPGDTIYITGMLELVEGDDGDFGEGIYLENEPVTVTIKDELKNYNKSYFYITVGKNITDTQIWSDSISGDELDIGSVMSDDELLITLPNKPINESNEFDWTDDFQWTTDMLYSMLENCNEIKVSNYNLKIDSAYKAMGGPVVYTLTRCKEWWDRFSTIELDDSGRGPAEWYDDYDDGRIGLISPYGTKNKNIRDIDWEDIDNREGWTISQEPYQIVDSLNGKGSELFILLDDKGRPFYDLIPKQHRERIKTNWEDRFYGKNINESDEDPLKWIKDVKTNQDIAKEIYDGLKWSKEENTYFVRNQWNGIPFSVRPFEKGRDKIILSPSSFHKNYRKYMIEKWGIYEIDNAKEIYFSLRKLIAQKIHNNLNESELSWIEGVKPEFNATMLRYGQKFKNNWGDVIRTIMFIGQDDPEVSYEKPMTGLTFKILDDPSGYIPYPSKPKDDPLNSELFMNPIEFDYGLKSGQYIPIFKDESFKLKESDFDWLDMGEPMSICEAQHKLNVGDTIIIDKLLYWEDSFSDEEKVSVENGTATVLAIDACNQIQSNNSSTAKTILIHVNEEYTGFDELWVRDFKPEYREPCMDGRCMFLICGESDEMDEIKITKLPSKIFGENKKEDLNWVSDTTNKVQTTGIDPDGNIISLQKVYFDFLSTIAKVEGNYNPRLESNATLDTKYTRKVKDYLNLDSRTYQGLGRELHLIGLDKAFKMYFDKKPNKTLTEGAGISFEARKWGETIYNEIMNNLDEKKRLIIDGYDHPEAFNGFPIDYVVIDFYDRLTGYGQEHSGYDKDGNYVVLLYIQPKLLQGQGGYNLKSVLNHEMKHAWEDYNRLSKGLPSIEHTKESQELYNRDFILMLSDQNITGPIKEILKYYYYLSNLEKSAYLENVYDQNPTYERVVREIARKDFESFKDRHDIDINWHLMNTAYDIPFLKKFKSPREFIDYSAEELRSKAVKMTKKINKMRYIHGK